jgi:hypothetical protein
MCWDNMLTFVGDWGKQRKSSVTVPGVPAEFQPKITYRVLGFSGNNVSGVKMWIVHRAFKFWWRFGMKYAENFQANCQVCYCFIMTKTDPIQAEQAAKNSPWWQTFRWRQRGPEMTEIAVRILLFCGFDTPLMRWVKCLLRICREIDVFFRLEYHMFYVLYLILTYLLTLRRKINNMLKSMVVGDRRFWYALLEAMQNVVLYMTGS